MVTVRLITCKNFGMIWSTFAAPCFSPPVAKTKEMWFYMKSGQKFTREDITKEKIELRAKADIENPDLMKSLIDEESGITRPGQLPKVDAASPAGAKQLLGAIGQASLALWCLGISSLTAWWPKPLKM